MVDFYGRGGSPNWGRPRGSGGFEASAAGVFVRPVPGFKIGVESSHRSHRLFGGGFDQAVEHNIAGEPENVVDAVVLAPRHRLFAAVMAVAADGDVGASGCARG